MNSKYEPTKEQSDVINYGNGNLLVSASAGSGKTTTMISRIIRLICDEGKSVKRMLVSTFTNASADDILKKLTDAINAKMEESRKRNDTDETERLQRELDYLPNAAIGTLHSWCQKVIKRFFYETGDDPAFSIVEPIEYNSWIRTAAEDIVEEELELREPEFMETYENLVYRREHKGLIEAIEKIIYFLENTVDPSEYLKSAVLCYSDEKYEKEYSELIVGERAKIQAMIDRLLIKMSNDESITPASLTKIKTQFADRLENKNADWDKNGKGFTGIWGDDRNEIKSRIDKNYWGLIERKEQIDNKKCERTAKVLCLLAEKTLKRVIEKKDEKGALTFSDLEHRTLRILNSPSADELKNTYDYIFIDEFQDINPVQNEIISKLDRNNLFFVGDVKQSIYGFRGCIAKAFSDKRKEYVSSGKVIDLNKNFRSKPGILNFCNAVFSDVMKMDFGGADYSSDSMFVIPSGFKDDSSVEIIKYGSEITTDSSEPDEIYSVRKIARLPETAKKEADADAVTARVASLIDNEGFSVDDIVILVRSRNSSALNLMQTLVNAGYPVSIDGKMTMTDNKSVRELLCYLKVINNKKDDISLLGAMRSFYGGFSDEEISKIRKCFPSSSIFLWEAIETYAGEKNSLGARIKSFIDEINGYTALSKTLSISELVGRITADKKSFIYALADEDGMNNSVSLGFLMDYTEKFTGQFYEFLESLEDTSPEVDGTAANGTIRIMTIHAAKGLEFPVVILYGLNGKFNTQGYNDGVHLLPMPEIGIAADIDDGQSEKIFSFPMEIAKVRKRRAEIEEELRLLYVAMTRAQEKLIILLKEEPLKILESNDEAKCWADWVAPKAGLIVNRASEEREKPAESSKSISVSADGYEKARKIIETEIPESDDIKKSVTGLLQSTEIDEGIVPIISLATEYETSDAMKRGTAYHAALEVYDYSRSFDSQFEEIISSVQDGALIDRAIFSTAVKNLQEEIAGRKIYREKKFMFAATDDRWVGKGTIIQGVIDLLVLGDENELIDYKTGELTAERREKYLLQLEIYKTAFEGITGRKIDRTRIYLIDKECFMDD